MSRRKKFAFGIITENIIKLSISLIGIILTPIIIDYVGKDNYGVWIIIGNVLGYMGLMDFGISGATTALVAKSDTSDSGKKLSIILSNSFFLQIFVSVAILLVGIILSFFLTNFINVNDTSKHTVFLTFFLSVIGYSISFPPKSLRGISQRKTIIRTDRTCGIWFFFGNNMY